MISTPRNKTKFALIYCMVIGLLLIGLLGCLSSGVKGSGVHPSPEDLQPLILSENPTNKVLRLWAPPSSGVSVLYDEWNFYLFGEVNDTYTVKINDFEAFNGSFDQSTVNLSYDASRLNTAHVLIEIGNRSYQWSNVIVNHQGIGYDGPGTSQGNNLKYSATDINIASLKSAVGVVIASLISIPIVWKGVKIWRGRQGVRVI